jgi:hypothetical protein
MAGGKSANKCSSKSEAGIALGRSESRYIGISSKKPVELRLHLAYILLLL